MTEKTEKTKKNTVPFASIHVPSEQKEGYRQHRNEFLERVNNHLEWNGVRPPVSISAVFRALLRTSRIVDNELVIDLDDIYEEANLK